MVVAVMPCVLSALADSAMAIRSTSAAAVETVLVTRFISDPPWTPPRYRAEFPGDRWSVISPPHRGCARSLALTLRTGPGSNDHRKSRGLQASTPPARVTITRHRD